MRAFIVAALVAVGSLVGNAAWAETVEVANVKYDTTLDLAGQKLVLNGAGIRYKFVVKVYTAGLYLTHKASTTQEVLAAPGPKRIHISMLREVDGNELWQRKWGSFPIRGGWGAGGSPVLHGDRIYWANDNERESFLAAIDKTSGEEVWRVARDEKSNWSTPYVWKHDLRTELVTIGTGKIRSYDLDGKVLDSCEFAPRK